MGEKSSRQRRIWIGERGGGGGVWIGERETAALDLGFLGKEGVEGGRERRWISRRRTAQIEYSGVIRVLRPDWFENELLKFPLLSVKNKGGL